MKKEIKIAGAGISGLTAGINLLKFGYKVTIYETRSNVGLRFNDDLQGIANWMSEKDILEEIQEANIKIDFFTKPFCKGTAISPVLNRKINFSSQKPIFYLVFRGAKQFSLDSSLKEQFLNLGGNIIFNRRASIDEIDICATGPQKVDLIALGYNFNTDYQDIAVLILDNNIAPKAYAYLLITQKKGTMAVVLSEQFEQQEVFLQKAIGIFSKEFNFTMGEKIKFGGFGNFRIPKTAIENKVLLTGEFAGFQDCAAEFGIYYAIKSGFLAAKSIIENKDYDGLWKQEFLDKMKASMVNRFMLEKLGNNSHKLIFNLLERYNRNIVGKVLNRHYSLCWRRKLLFPIIFLLSKNK